MQFSMMHRPHYVGPFEVTPPALIAQLVEHRLQIQGSLVQEIAGNFFTNELFTWHNLNNK